MKMLRAFALILALLTSVPALAVSGYVNSASIESGGTFTAGAGTNRRVVAVGAVAKDTGTPTWAATFGGVAMTLDAETPYFGDYKLVVFSLKESSIPSGSQALVVTNVGGSILTDFYGAIYTLTGRDQTTALDSGFTATSTGTGQTGFTTASLTNAAGSFLIAAMRLTPADDIDMRPGGWANRVSNHTSQVVHVEDKDDAAGATATYGWTFAGNDFVYQTVAYKQASAGGLVVNPISGKGGAAARPVNSN